MSKFKLVLLLSICSLMLCTRAYAEMKLPPLKEGIAYSITDSKINFLSTIELLKFKGFNVEVGYAGQAPNTGDKAVAVLSYELLNLKNLGVAVPILDLVSFNLGYYIGVGRIELNPGNTKANNEFDQGVSLTVLNFKF